jgi:hypothetical protein
MVAAQSAESEPRQIARVVLANWKDKRAHCDVVHALPLRDLKPSAAQMKDVLPAHVTQTVVVVGLDVDEHGCVQRIEVLRSGRYPNLVSLWISHLRASRFVPRTQGGKFVADHMVLSLSPEAQ